MAVLVLLNGGPATGKSTLAQLWAAERPLALALDIDVLRSMIADWQSHPLEAGERARELALTAISDHLSHGHDVIVPQLLTRESFIVRLSRVATEADARFIEVALVEPPGETADVAVTDRWYVQRGERVDDDADARAGARSVHGSAGLDAVTDLRDRYERFAAGRTNAIRVAPVDGDIPGSLERLRVAIASPLPFARDDRHHQ